MSNPSQTQVEKNRKHSVSFRDTVVKKQNSANGGLKTATVLQYPTVHSDSSTTLSSVWDIEVKIRDLELEDSPKHFWQTVEEQKNNEKRAPIVHFRRYISVICSHF